MKTSFGFKRVTEQEAIRNYFNSMPGEVKASFQERIDTARQIWKQQALTAKYERPRIMISSAPLTMIRLI